MQKLSFGFILFSMLKFKFGDYFLCKVSVLRAGFEISHILELEASSAASRQQHPEKGCVESCRKPKNHAIELFFAKEEEATREPREATVAKATKINCCTKRISC